MNIALNTFQMRKIKSILFFIGVLALWFACSKIVDNVPVGGEKSSAAFSSNLAFVDPDSWYTIGHDAQRTSASNGTITTLTKQWNYTPLMPSGSTSYQTGAGNMIADQNNIWLKTEYYTPGTSGTGDKTMVEKISLSGTPVYSNSSHGINHSLHTWMAKMGNYIYLNDDDIEKIDASTGSFTSTIAFDYWGEICPKPDGTKFFSGNALFLDLGAVWSGAITSNMSVLYKNYGDPTGASQRGFKDDNRMAMCYENDTLFYAPTFKFSTTTYATSGIYAYKEDGTLIWYKACRPTGTISCTNRLVYSIEGDSLVARNKTNGNVNWYQTFTGYIFNGQPPVLADSKVIITTSTGIWAYNQVTGVAAWNKAFGDIVKPAGTFADLVFWYEQQRKEYNFCFPVLTLYVYWLRIVNSFFCGCRFCFVFTGIYFT